MDIAQTNGSCDIRSCVFRVFRISQKQDQIDLILLHHGANLLLAAHMAVRQSFDNAQNTAAEEEDPQQAGLPQPPPSDQQETTP